MSIVLKLIGWVAVVLGGFMVVTNSLASYDEAFRYRLISAGLEAFIAGALILAVAKIIDLLDDIARSLRATHK